MAASSRNEMSGAAHGTSGWVEGAGPRLHYVEWGPPQAPTLLLLHGLRAYARWFDEFAEAAQERYRVIALDQRGRGRSERAPGGDYSRAAYVADVEAVVRALGLERFVLIGHSMGGLNAIPYTARHPEKVRALVLVDIGPDLQPEGMQRLRRELAETPADFVSWEAARAFLAARHPQASARNLATRLDWMLMQAADGRIAWRIDPAIFAPDQPFESAEEIWANYSRIRCPVLVLRGGETDLLTVATCARMAAAVPDCRWLEIPRAGHMVLEDNPADFNQAVLAFLADLA
jgi:esterase